jgi:hypothetical protein
MRTTLILALWLLAGWNLGAMLEFAVGLPTWVGVVGGLAVGLFAVRSSLRGVGGRRLTAPRLSPDRR